MSPHLPPTIVRVDEQHHRTEVALHPGEALEVTLAENPTTGFRWRLVSQGTPVMQLEANRYHASSGRPGASGQHTWRLRVAATGNATVEWVHSRSWENVKPERRFSLRVKSRNR